MMKKNYVRAAIAGLLIPTGALLMVLGAAKLTGMLLPELPGCQRKNVPAKKNGLGRYVKRREGAYHDCG